MNSQEYVQHTAVLREAQLAASVIASGVTALGRASHAQVGYYHEGFFGLSIGLERLAKLLYLADFAIDNGGSFPAFQTLQRRFGHNLEALLAECNRIGARAGFDHMYIERPKAGIHDAIVCVLSEFAKSSRYHNLDYLTKPQEHRVDPVAAWWDTVGEPICAMHYSKRMQERDEAHTAMMNVMFGGRSVVMHTAETGERIDDIPALMRRAGATRVVQRYGRMYTLQLVRWLSAIAWELSMLAGYELQMPALFGFNEPFNMFCNDDGMLRNKRTWRLYL